MKKHWKLITFMLATILFLGLGGCTESEKIEVIDEGARGAILKNFGYIRENRATINELQDRGMSWDKKVKESLGIVISPRTSPIPVNRGKKFTLL